MMTKRVLVAYGSKRGGTEDIAVAIANTLRAEGHIADVFRASGVSDDDVRGYDAVVVGGGLYAMRWVGEARRFVRDHAAALRERPVWMFSSGPLDASANKRRIGPTSSVARSMAKIGARGHATFGGRLEPEARGFPAALMARKLSGDWRSWEQIRGWARGIAAELPTARPLPVVAPQPGRVLAALCFLVGIAAIAGGVGLVGWPDGSALRAPLALLEGSPFESFLIPGLILLVVIGFGSTLAGLLVIRESPAADPAALAAGLALLGWITFQMAMLHTANWLQLGCIAMALAIIALSLRRHTLAERPLTA